jgi:hypothetical protein
MNRFQLYIRLINISFWICALALLRSLGRISGLAAHPIPAPFDRIVGMIAFANLLLAIFLVIARFMRDEFAERIWHLAAQRFVYFLVGAPLIMISLMSIFEDAIRVRVNNSWVSTKLLAEFQRHPEPVWHYIGGMGQAVIAFALLAPTIFICIYKWQLWRDSR